jgi:endonuclease G
VLHIEQDGPDMAFLEVDPASNGTASLAKPIALAGKVPAKERFVAVIGYPARDSRIPDLDLMEKIFGDVFDKKRLAPGQITGATEDRVLHDCSTLGGNSGSVVLDLGSGEAAALHFAGRFLEANYAVPAPLIRDRVDRLSSGKVAVPAPRPDRNPEPWPPAQPQVAVHTSVREEADDQSASLTLTIPVTVSVQVGRPSRMGAGSAAPGPRRTPAEEGGVDEFIAEEAPPESYSDREGFRGDFLGKDGEVSLPEVRSGAADVVTFEENGRESSELRYQHFSLVMNGRRRMCFFSACNVDGNQSKRTVRAGWKFDSRIPRKYQIMKECYGSAPKFSRGHMTRREDPAWGDRDAANLGNEDSMHVTNTVPQMQSLNGGIWLSLEDYALQHAREDNMRISVLTGPFLRKDDPVRFGVQVPREFWKVIAFIHDQGRELTATGYSISQEDLLREEEFVFGEFRTFQRSLSWIEREAGISFGALSGHDPRGGEEEAVEAPLTSLGQIRFLR